MVGLDARGCLPLLWSWRGVRVGFFAFYSESREEESFGSQGIDSQWYEYWNRWVGLFDWDVGRGERRIDVFFESGPAVEMGDGGSRVEYQQAVWIAAYDGEDGCGYSMEVVTLPRGAADAVVLDV